jgi:hypothetical protein
VQSALLILGLTVLVAVTVITFTARRRESRALRGLVNRRHLNFSPEDLIDLHERYYRLSIIRRGHSRFAWNLLYGSADEGLVSIFCYRCDIGFGVNQTHRTCWLAVMETTRQHAAWQAERRPFTDPLRTEQHERMLGAFMIRADEQSTLDRLPSVNLQNLLDEFPLLEHTEVRGQLVCVAAPCGNDTRTPEQLLEAVGKLSRLVEEI